MSNTSWTLHEARKPLSSSESLRPLTPRLPTVRSTAYDDEKLKTTAPSSMTAAREDWVLEESFDCTVEELTSDAIRLHTRTLSGEEGLAWLPLERVPTSERTHIMLGAPVRITVLYDKNAKTRRRESEIRVLRRSQWHVEVTAAAAKRIDDLLVDAMRAVLDNA